MHQTGKPLSIVPWIYLRLWRGKDKIRRVVISNEPAIANYILSSQKRSSIDDNTSIIYYYRNAPSNRLSAIKSFWYFVRKKIHQKSSSAHSHRLSRIPISNDDLTTLNFSTLDFLASPETRNYILNNISHLNGILVDEVKKIEINSQLNRNQMKNLLLEICLFASKLLFHSSLECRIKWETTNESQSQGNNDLNYSSSLFVSCCILKLAWNGNISIFLSLNRIWKQSKNRRYENEQVFFCDCILAMVLLCSINIICIIYIFYSCVGVCRC